MGLLSMHITGEVASREEAEKFSEKLRGFFPSDNFNVNASYREDLNVDKIAEPK